MIVTIKTRLNEITTRIRVDRKVDEIKKMFENGDLEYPLLQTRTADHEPMPVYCLGDQIGIVLSADYEIQQERLHRFEEDHQAMFESIELALRGEADGTEALNKLMRLKTLFLSKIDKE